MGHIIAQGLSVGLGQQVMVDNRGGNAVIPIELKADMARMGKIIKTTNVHAVSQGTRY